MSKRQRERDDECGDEDEGDEILTTMKIHPLLQTKTESTEISNPLTKQDWRKTHRELANPYINQQDFQYMSNPKRQLRTGSGNSNRSLLEKSRDFKSGIIKEIKEKEQYQILKDANLIPDLKKGEDKYESCVVDNVPPYVEWWDERYLVNPAKGDYTKKSYVEEDNGGGKDGDEDEDMDIITSYVEHPVPLEAPWRRLLVVEKPIYLTKEERRKMRKNRRVLEMKDKQDRIKLGLEEVPKNKVRLKNLVNVLTNESIVNPTEVEERVRGEIEDRRLEHERMNLDRKLSKGDKHAKIEHDQQTDVLKGIHCMAFKIKRVVNGKQVFKIDMNAKQLGLNGVCCNIRGGESLIIAEGGFKSIEKYRKLLMSRIKWNEDDKGGVSNGGGCELVWGGEISEFRFQKWTMYNFDDEIKVVEFLKKFKVDNYL